MAIPADEVFSLTMTDDMIARSDLRAEELLAEHLERTRSMIGPVPRDADPIPVEMQKELKIGPDYDPHYSAKLAAMLENEFGPLGEFVPL